MAIKDSGENKDNSFSQRHWSSREVYFLLYQMGNLFKTLNLHKIYNAARHFKCSLHLVHDYKIISRKKKTLCVFYLHFSKFNFEAIKWIIHQAWCLRTLYRAFYFHFSLSAHILHRFFNSHLRMHLLSPIRQKWELWRVFLRYTQALGISCHIEWTTSHICHLPFIFTIEVN